MRVVSQLSHATLLATLQGFPHVHMGPALAGVRSMRSITQMRLPICVALRWAMLRKSVRHIFLRTLAEQYAHMYMGEV